MYKKGINIILFQLVLLVFVNGQSVTRFEYFIDTDPGVGNGISFASTTADSVSVNIPLNVGSLSMGFHVVGIRSVDVNGHWSHVEFAHLYVETQDTINRQIATAEFFIGDTDPGLASGRSIAINNPADSVTVIADTILNNLPIGQYKIHVRFKDARGKWSHLESKKFTVCSGYGPLSEMTYQIEGNTVFFTNQSVNDTGHLWKFGDNTTSILLNPIKTYSSAGNYDLQLISNNVCGADTLNETMQIRGLQRVKANRAGNAGISTLMFEGFGFITATDVKLVLGNQVINPVAKFLVSSNRIRANFDLTGIAPGIYRAVATLGSAFDTLNDAVIIENNIQADLTLAQTGGGVSRPNNEKIFSTISNPGSQDVIMVPYIATVNVLPGLDANTNFFTATDMVFLQNQGIFQHTLQYLADHSVPAEVMSANDLDSARGRHFVAYYKVKVPAHSTITEIIKKRNPANQLISFQGGSMVLKELMDSYALQGIINTTYRACYSTFLKHEVEKQLNIVINKAAWENCFTPTFNELMVTLAGISQNPLLEQFGVPMQSGFSALLAKMADCAGSGVPSNLGGIQFKRIIQGVMNNWILQEDIDSLDPDCIDTTVLFTQGRPAAGGKISGTERVLDASCSDCPGALIFPEMCETCGPILYAAKKGKKNKVLKRQFGLNSAFAGCQEWCENSSIDPNVKSGPGNNDDRKYINQTGEVSYRISFENLASATAPAAFVEIRDTIDKNVFDIRTLQLGLFGWGDSVINAEANTQNISILKDIRPAHPNQLRIDVVTDTSSGELRWRFRTLDLINLQLTGNPSEGFLPPNTDGISGTGYVTFSVKPVATISNGAGLYNSATIIFDNNPPINTDIWEYRIDTLKPASTVNALPAVINVPDFKVSWVGSDAHSGIDKFSVYVSINDSAYAVWQSLTTALSDTFHGEFGKTYKFISIALDKAGNFEDPPLDALNNPDAVTTIQLPLPLNLIDFTAVKTPDGKKTDLHWQTAQEQNVSHFELQRSADGINYINIGQVRAQNNPIGTIYTWRDLHPLSKINYYRMRMVDNDASYKYSPVRIVYFTEKDEVLVFPTITKDLVFIQSGRQLTAELFDVQGIKLHTQIINQNASFDMSRYPAGVYYIRILPENKTCKIVKR